MLGKGSPNGAISATPSYKHFQEVKVTRWMPMSVPEALACSPHSWSCLPQTLGCTGALRTELIQGILGVLAHRVVWPGPIHLFPSLHLQPGHDWGGPGMLGI